MKTNHQTKEEIKLKYGHLPIGDYIKDGGYLIIEETNQATPKSEGGWYIEDLDGRNYSWAPLPK